MVTRAAVLLLLLLGAAAPVAAVEGEAIPDVVRQTMVAALEEVNAAVLSNPYLMQDFGVKDGVELADARIDVANAFAMRRLAVERAGAAGRIDELLEATPYYYVPYCIGSRCPGMAAFVLDPATGTSDFVSIGEAPLARALAETEERRRELGIDAAAPVVFVSGPQTPLIYFRDPADGTERLLVGTRADAHDALLYVLGDESAGELSPADRAEGRLDVLNLAQVKVYSGELLGAAQKAEAVELAAVPLPVGRATEEVEKVAVSGQSQGQEQGQNEGEGEGDVRVDAPAPRSTWGLVGAGGVVAGLVLCVRLMRGAARRRRAQLK